MNKTGKTGLPQVVMLLIGALLIVVLGKEFGLIPQTTTGTSDVVGAPGGPIEVGVESVTFSPSAVDIWTSTVAAGGNHRYSRNNEPFANVANLGEVTLSPGDDLILVLGYSNMTSGTSVSQFISKVVSGKVPNKGRAGVLDLIGIEDNANKLYRNGTMTIVMYTNQNKVIALNNGTGDSNQSMSTADSKNLKLELQAQSERAPCPYGGMVYFDYDSTRFEKPTLSPSSGSLVARDSITTTAAGRQLAFYPIGPVINNPTQTFSIALQAKSGVDPAGTYSVRTDQIKIGVVCSVPFENTDSGVFQIGIEDQDGTALTHLKAQYDNWITIV